MECQLVEHFECDLIEARMYERPTKGDLDRNLSRIFHEAHHKARAECVRLASEFAARGMSLSTSRIGAAVGCLDTIHADALGQAILIIREFAERMQVAPKDITTWARPHLENLGTTVLAQIPAAGFPAEQQRVRAQYSLVFQQRLDGALRDFEIGFVGGRSVMPGDSGLTVPSARQPKEVISLKPGAWGVSIDLKELWGRRRDFINWIRKLLFRSN